MLGDPTEGALLVAAAREGLRKNELEEILPRVGEIPFDSSRKRMTTIHRMSSGDSQAAQIMEPLIKRMSGHQNPYIAFTKGAVDGLLEISKFVWADDHVEPLTEAWKERILAANRQLAQNGMRVLGLAFNSFQAQPGGMDGERDLIFVGLAGMLDPPRPEAREAALRLMVRCR